MLLAMLAYIIWGTDKAEGYITGTVKKGSVTTTIPATGTIEPVSTVSLSFKNAEIIKKIHVKVGDHVTTGQLLAEQEGDNLEAQLIQSSASLKGAVAKLELLKKGATEEDIAQAEVSVSMAQAAYDIAKLDLEQSEKLFQVGAISKSELDAANISYINAEGKLKQAEQSLRSLKAGNRPEDIAAAAAQVESSNAQLKIAEKDLVGANMFAPMDGIVSEVNGGEGQRATANNNSTSSGSGFIVVISEALQVRAQVNEADIGSLKAGQKAEFTVNSFPNRTFTGKVSSISPQAYTVSNVQIYDTVIQLDENQQGLMAGMPANVNIIIDRQENVLTIPKGAVTYASSYLAQTGQSVSAAPAATEGGSAEGSADSTRRGPRSSGDADSTGGGGTEAAAEAKGNNRRQISAVLVLDKTGSPVPMQVVLGLSDNSKYEILEGLSEGDTVVVGTSGASGAGNQGQTTNTPIAPGGMTIRSGSGMNR